MTRLMTLVVGLLMLYGCSTAPRTDNEKAGLRDEVTASLSQMGRMDTSLQNFLDNAHGYAVFPSVGKGGIIIGGAWGQGEVYQGKILVGYSELTQATIGFQLGGQSYAQVIVFQTPEALAAFKSGNYTFSANASAVALKSGAAAAAEYQNGVAIFTMPNGGAMFEASVGGQKFSYLPK